MAMRTPDAKRHETLPRGVAEIRGSGCVAYHLSDTVKRQYDLFDDQQ